MAQVVTSCRGSGARGDWPPSVWAEAWPNFGPPLRGTSHSCHRGHEPTHAEAFASPRSEVIEHVEYMIIL